MRLKDKEGGLNSVDMVKRDRWVDASRACTHEAGSGFVIPVFPTAFAIWVFEIAQLLSFAVENV